jgi:hypothetical protein
MTRTMARTMTRIITRIRLRPTAGARRLFARLRIRRRRRRRRRVRRVRRGSRAGAAHGSGRAAAGKGRLRLQGLRQTCAGRRGGGGDAARALRCNAQSAAEHRQVPPRPALAVDLQETRGIRPGTLKKSGMCSSWLNYWIGDLLIFLCSDP